MRVATRRMRAAWRVFGDGFRPDRTRRLRGRLRDHRRAARRRSRPRRPARGRRGAPGHPRHPRGSCLRAAPRRVARRARGRPDRPPARARQPPTTSASSRTTARSSSPRATASVPPASPVSPHRVRDTAASRIWLAYEQVRAYESVLRWADIETIHQLRIAGKWLRYTLEFFREALGPEVDQLIPRVVVAPGPPRLAPRRRRDDRPDARVPGGERRITVTRGDAGSRDLPRHQGARARAPAPDDGGTVARGERAPVPAPPREGRLGAVTDSASGRAGRGSRPCRTRRATRPVSGSGGEPARRAGRASRRPRSRER